ncbi:MAG: transposase [Thermoplasmatales archaeon]
MNRHIQRPDPSIRQRIRGIASNRQTYEYRRVWAVLRNSGTHVNQKTVRKVQIVILQNLPAPNTEGEQSPGTFSFHRDLISSGKLISLTFTPNQE